MPSPIPPPRQNKKKIHIEGWEPSGCETIGATEHPGRGTSGCVAEQRSLNKLWNPGWMKHRGGGNTKAVGGLGRVKQQDQYFFSPGHSWLLAPVGPGAQNHKKNKNVVGRTYFFSPHRSRPPAPTSPGAQNRYFSGLPHSDEWSLGS